MEGFGRSWTFSHGRWRRLARASRLVSPEYQNSAHRDPTTGAQTLTHQGAALTCLGSIQALKGGTAWC